MLEFTYKKNCWLEYTVAVDYGYNQYDGYYYDNYYVFWFDEETGVKHDVTNKLPKKVLACIEYEIGKVIQDEIEIERYEYSSCDW